MPQPVAALNPATTESLPPHGGGLFCIIFHMIFINIILGIVVGLLAHWGGLHAGVSIILGWASFRAEVAMTNQIAQCKMLQLILVNDNKRTRMALEAHEQAVASIARNN